MSAGSGAEAADRATSRIRVSWEETKHAWRDEAAKAFERSTVQTLIGYGEAARRLAESMESILANARRMAP